MFFLVSSGFLLRTLPWMQFLRILFVIAESWTLTLTEANEACSSLDVVLGSFVTSWTRCWCSLEVILVGWPLPGRFTTVQVFSICGQRLNWSRFVIFARLFLECYWVPLDGGMMCCFLRSTLLRQTGSIYGIFWFNRSGSNQTWVWLVKLKPAFQNMWFITVNSWFNKGVQLLFYTG